MRSPSVGKTQILTKGHPKKNTKKKQKKLGFSHLLSCWPKPVSPPKHRTRSKILEADFPLEMGGSLEDTSLLGVLLRLAWVPCESADLGRTLRGPEKNNKYIYIYIDMKEARRHLKINGFLVCLCLGKIRGSDRLFLEGARGLSSLVGGCPKRYRFTVSTNECT